jgi:heme exporter protein D
MNWNSPAEFFAMGGYAFYVWGSFIVTVVALAIEVMGLRRRQRQALLNLRRGKAS